MAAKRIDLPLRGEALRALRAGDEVALYGTAYAARDAAHKRLLALLQAGKALPFPLDGACIYYAGPCPAAPGEAIGPCGPTTSGRMDAYTPALIAHGLTGMIGKGARSQAVKDAMREKAVYFAATGGAAILIAGHIRQAEVIAFPELGAEAVLRLELEGLPALVAVDSHGGDLYAREEV